MDLMRKRTVVGLFVATSFVLALCAMSASAVAESAKPDATLEFNGGSVAAGIGVSWGAGVLKYKGRSYPFKVNGLSLVGVGLTQASASGEVFGLKQLDDFNGNYVSGGAGLTVAGGGGAAGLKNQNGVVIHVKGTTKGAKVSIGGGGVGIELLK
jgi:hypothetical protein